MKNRLWKNWFLLLLGAWITILPWTGFPQQIKTPITVVSGLGVVLLSFVMARPESTRPSRSSEQDEFFAEDEFPESHDK